MTTHHTARFVEELRRRHVWRVAAAYVIGAWLLVQVATQVFPFFGIPYWTVRFVVLALALGFPLVIVLAWVYEITPEGIRRTAPVDSPQARSAEARRDVGRRLDVVIIAILATAVALLGWRLLALRHAPAAAPPQHVVVAKASAPAPAPRTPAIPQKSVAVLPFANESGRADEQYFSDGLSEGLITTLSQFAGLKVISRNSAFQFRNSHDSAAAIGEALGVAHLLEGSVQRAQDRVRITASLVDAADGSILWSKSYDEPYKDLFALQDSITHAVADVLQAKLLVQPGAVVQSERPPGGDLDAYNDYQRGIAAVALGTKAGLYQAIDAFDAAVRRDPRYAAAYARSSTSWSDLASQFLGDAQARQANTHAREAADKALALDPQSSLAHQARFIQLQRVDMDWRAAATEAQHAFDLDPNDSLAQFRLAEALAVLGQNRRALELIRQSLGDDPLHASRYYWLANWLAATGQLDAAHTAIANAITMQPGATSYHEQLAIIGILRGDAAAALAAARAEPAGVWRDAAMALATQIGGDRDAAVKALHDLIAGAADSAPYQIAEVYAVRGDADAVFQWLERARVARDPGVMFLLSDPLILRYRNDPRFAAFCAKVGLPATTDAIAMK